MTISSSVPAYDPFGSPPGERIAAAMAEQNRGAGWSSTLSNQPGWPLTAIRDALEFEALQAERRGRQGGPSAAAKRARIRGRTFREAIQIVEAAGGWGTNASVEQHDAD